MTRRETEAWLLALLADRFEIQDPGLDDDLREEHEFDSIDAIELLASIEDRLRRRLDQDQKKKAMDIRTINQIIDYIEEIQGEIGEGAQ